MNFCNVCGKELVDNATVCPVCGASITPVQTPTAESPLPQFVPQQNPIQPAPQQIPVEQAQPQNPVQPAQPQYPVQPAQPQYPMQGNIPQQYVAPTQPVYQYPMQPAPVSKAAKILGLISFFCGLFSIIFCWICWVPVSGFMLGIYCIMASIAGLILSSISRKKGTAKKAKTGKVLSIIGLIVAIIASVFSIVLTAAFEDGDYYDYDDDYYYSDYDYDDYDYDDDWLDYTNA